MINKKCNDKNCQCHEFGNEMTENLKPMPDVIKFMRSALMETLSVLAIAETLAPSLSGNIKDKRETVIEAIRRADIAAPEPLLDNRTDRQWLIDYCENLFPNNSRTYLETVYNQIECKKQSKREEKLVANIKEELIKWGDFQSYPANIIIENVKHILAEHGDA